MIIVWSFEFLLLSLFFQILFLEKGGSALETSLPAAPFIFPSLVVRCPQRFGNSHRQIVVSVTGALRSPGNQIVICSLRIDVPLKHSNHNLVATTGGCKSYLLGFTVIKTGSLVPF